VQFENFTAEKKEGKINKKKQKRRGNPQKIRVLGVQWVLHDPSAPVIP